jgi:hypothetical protein
MFTKHLYRDIARPSASLEKVAGQVAKHPQLLTDAFAGLEAETARIKYGCLKVLRLISEKNPKVLYPEFDRFVN